MTCGDARERLEALLTHHLPVGEQEEVRRHLERCSDCAQEFETIAALKALVRDAVAAHPAPPALRARVMQILSTLQPARTRRHGPLPHRWQWAAAAVVLGAVLTSFGVFMWWPFLSPAPQLGALLLPEIVAVHREMIERREPLEPPRLDHLKAYFKARLGFAPALPFAGDAEFQLLGGYGAEIVGRQAACVVYAKGPTIISLMVWSGDELELPKHGRRLSLGGVPAYLTQHRGYRLLLWRQGRLTYAIATDLDPADLAAFFLRVRQS